MQLTIAIKFSSSKYVEEKRVMYSRSGNTKAKTDSDANDVTDTLFKSLHLRYKENLEKSMKGSDFNFNSFQLMYYQCHKVNFIRGGSYTDIPDWIKKEKATKNPKSTDNVFNTQQLLH